MKKSASDPDQRLILASGSPRRLELLTRWGITYRALVASGVDESKLRGDAVTVTRALALEKARWSRQRALEEREDLALTWVLGADTLVSIDGDVLGKPVDEDDARTILRRLSGRAHEVITGVAVIDPHGREHIGVESSTVVFKPLSHRDVEAYIASGDAMGKAGAYGIQSGGARLVEGFRGCYYNIVGLPMRLALTLLGRDDAVCDCDQLPGQLGERGCRKSALE